MTSAVEAWRSTTLRRAVGGRLGAVARVLLAIVALTVPASALELVYVHDPACPYCRQWERVIGPAYPNSAEGRRAPLRALVLAEIRAAGLRLKAPVRYTPTFILIDGVQELGRIEGYPGEEFFWLRLEQLLDLAVREPHPAAPAPGQGVTRTRLSAGIR